MTSVEQPFTSRPQDDFTKEEQDRLIDACMQMAASCTVGFAIFSKKDNQEDARALGSGTLVVIHGRHGILTAAHVLNYLPKSGEVGIIQFADGSDAAPTRPFILMELCCKFIVPGYCGAQLGPDIGFLTLPDVAVVAMKMDGLLFLNLDSQRDDVLLPPRKDGYSIDGVSGVVGEWTGEGEPEGRFSRVKTFGALYGVGGLTKLPMSGDFDLFDLAVSFDNKVGTPDSYKGISGGGLLRCHFHREECGTVTNPKCTLIGVAFWQDINDRNERIVRSHGPKSIYGPLYDYLNDKV